MNFKLKLKDFGLSLAMLSIFLYGGDIIANDFVSRVDTAKQKDRVTIPYTLPWDDMPIDLSFVYKNEKPAGKHGFLKAKGDDFVFEDGTVARFWGTNFNAAQNFPSHEHSEKVAKRLAKVGINMVRLHQLDAEFATPNLFSFSRGENKTDTQSLDPESMDRLDYLIYCLKKEGIYVYLDLITYRQFRSGDGIESIDQLDYAARPHATYNRKLIELQKKFNEDLWRHVNPYTKLAYKDDPVIALTEVINESDLWSHVDRFFNVEPYITELENLYIKWAAENNIKVGNEKVKTDRKTNVNIQRFFIDITTEYYREMMAHMRDLGVKIPIAGTNWPRNAAHLTAQLEGDFTDTHRYLYYHYRTWANKEFINDPMTGQVDNMIASMAFNSVHGKPLFISEWENTWPNEFRADSPVLMAAIGSFQGWGGSTIHTYRYSLDEDVDMLAKPITGEAIGGKQYRSGMFDTFNDPAKFGLFYHAALITRRGDVRQADKTVSVVLDDLFAEHNVEKGAYALTGEQHRIKTVVPGQSPTGDIQIGINDELVKGREILSDTKELYRNLDKQIGWINSPRTKVVYGFVGKEGKIELSGVNIDTHTDFATIAISSLTDDPITSSGNMLLTAVGRADNTNVQYNDTHTKLLDLGHGPIQVEVIEAAIEIRTDKNLRVLAINPQGVITGFMPTTHKDGVVSFELGKAYQSMYYLIQEM